MRANALNFDDDFIVKPIIKILGVGGAGCNAINNMISSGVRNVEFIAVNTDLQTLSKSKAPVKIQIGERLTGGLGAGSNPDRGAQSALEDIDKLKEAIEGAHMIFISAGLGGGTGTGAAPVIAKLAKEMNILTVAIVTQPFTFENRIRYQNFLNGYNQMRECVDSMIIIKNDKVFEILPGETPIDTAFSELDTILKNALRGVIDIVLKPGQENVDFADIKTIFSYKGFALMGLGEASGMDRAREALTKALESPLLDNLPLNDSKGVIVNVTAGINENQLTLEEYRYIHETINSKLSEGVHVIAGRVVEDDIGDLIRVTIIATGFDYQDMVHKEERKKPADDVTRYLGNRERQPSFSEKPYKVKEDVPEITTDDLDNDAEVKRESKPQFAEDEQKPKHPLYHIATKVLAEREELRTSLLGETGYSHDSSELDNYRKVPTFVRKAVSREIVKKIETGEL
jgi:cell division protein FtsZ